MHSQKWQGKFLSAREEDEDLDFEGCFWWLKQMAKLPDTYSAVMCRLCDKAPESVLHVLAGCTALAQNKYLIQHNTALKTLFFEIMHDLGLIESVPP